MKRILLDENIPIGMLRLLTGCDAHHVHDLGWTGLSDTMLLASAETAGFAVFVTADQNLIHQQNRRGKTLAIIAQSSDNWTRVKAHHRAIETAIDQAAPGTFLSLALM
jgi:predicted nuclease of predicted toxin-antitoxin system